MNEFDPPEVPEGLTDEQKSIFLLGVAHREPKDEAAQFGKRVLDTIAGAVSDPGRFCVRQIDETVPRWAARAAYLALVGEDIRLMPKDVFGVMGSTMGELVQMLEDSGEEDLQQFGRTIAPAMKVLQDRIASFT